MPATTEELRSIIDRINLHLKKHSLTWEDFPSFLRSGQPSVGSTRASRIRLERLLTTAEAVIRKNEIPSDLNSFRLLCEELESTLDIPFRRSAFDTKAAIFRREVRRLFAGVLALFSTYMVIGAILEGHSSLFSSSPILAVALLILLIILLAAFEGLQISVTTLRLKDLHAFQAGFPRAYALHRIFRSEEGTRRFLAGRQLFVIVLVFFAAQLTSFPDLHHWPLTDSPFPTWMIPWFPAVFLRLGMLGAFFVLWTGQLAPQFIANKYPHGFLNLLGMGLALRLALLVEALGLTMPGDWLSAWVKKQETIPASARESFRQALAEIDGYGCIGLKKIWNIEDSQATLSYKSSTIFALPGFDRIIDDGLEIKGENPRPRFSFDLISAGSDISARQISAESIEDERLPEGWLRFKQMLQPNWGPFLPGDVLITDTEVMFRRASVDAFRISKPTRFILFRIKFLSDPQRIGSARVQTFKMDEAIVNIDPIADEELLLQYDEAGIPFFEYFGSYPPANTYYIISWDVQYKGSVYSDRPADQIDGAE